MDPSTGTKNEQKVVEAFNKKYKGTYELDVDWIVETEADYRQNLKRLNATDELPDIITDLRMLPSFYQKMIAENRIADLTPYIDADEEWSSMIEPVVQEGCTYADGNIYLAPISTAAFSCCGIFWNQELFNKAGIDSFPTTWDEFWACCDKLTNAGITPLALHTDGTGWAPMLLASAAVASSSEEGAEFMSLIYPGHLPECFRAGIGKYFKTAVFLYNIEARIMILTRHTITFLPGKQLWFQMDIG